MKEHEEDEIYVVEVVGVTFSDSDSAPIPKVLNPGPGTENFQIWESNSCYNRCNRKLPMFFLLQKWPLRLLLLAKLTSDRIQVRFFKNFYSGSRSERKTQSPRTLLESTPALRVSGHLWYVAVIQIRKIRLALIHLE